MAISPYFHHQTFKTEQKLFKDLLRESIFLRGNDYMYIPRKKINLDTLFGEDVQSLFDKPIILEMYCKNNPEMNGEFLLSKFGLQDPREMTFIVSCDRFMEEFLKIYPDVRDPMPIEGDLIYHDLTKFFFEVTSFNDLSGPFFPTGISTYWEIDCKRFIYNAGEKIDIGKPTTDWNVPAISADQFLPTKEELEIINTVDPVNDKDQIQLESDAIANFDESDPFSESPDRGSHY